VLNTVSAESYKELLSVSLSVTSISTSFDFASVLTTPRSVLTLLSPFVPHEISLNVNISENFETEMNHSDILDVCKCVYV